ncbi:MAG TPA: A/G-specific adenine glycosylase [Longimicrobiales bacterium]
MNYDLEPDPDDIRRRLLDFYDARARDLPWRRDADPYRVWVSEIMLQQTRVETAVPYYERWLERFPTVDALAEAPIDDVLHAWAGLGYYSRARNLHRAAQVVRERHRGTLPDDPDALRDLPGIGDYTAGAIASIAFGRPEPAVDGNVRRVLSRLYDLPDPGAAELRARAAALVDADRPGDFNQALMELGATVCTPRTPACDGCPLASHCRARAAGTQLERPRPKRAKPVPECDVGTAIVVAPGGALLLVRRPDDGLLGGLWEFPGEPVRPGEASVEAARRAAAAAVGGAGTATTTARSATAAVAEAPAEAPAEASVDATPTTASASRSVSRATQTDGTPLGAVTHTFTHRRITYHAFRFAAEQTATESAAQRAGGGERRAWVAPAEIDDFAISAAQRRILALLREE